MGIADPPCDRTDSEYIHKDPAQGGNVDSGYHSFTNLPNFYQSEKDRSDEMITSLPHDAAFPHPHHFRTQFEPGQVNDPSEVNSRTTQHNLDMYAAPNPNKEEAGRDTIARQLAEKVQFCLKLGYGAEHIRQTLKKIGPNASKNDLLKALGDSTDNVVLSQNQEESEVGFIL